MVDAESVKATIRRRIIGTAAIVAIFMSITPLLFDAAGYKERQLENRIPTAPDRYPVMEVTPLYQEIAEPSAAADPAPTAKIPAPSETVISGMGANGPDLRADEDTPGLDSRGIPVAWSLQLASFKDESNAKALRSDLNKAGYKVYIRHGGDLVRVYIGPEMQRTRLEKLQETIKSDYSLDGMIVRFTTE